MNNLEKLLQDATESERVFPLVRIFSAGTPCEECLARESCEDNCVISRAKWLLQEYAEPDSWEKIEADAKLLSCEYWKCCGMSCRECPAYFNGFIKPKEFYGVGSCDKAKACDLVARCKKLAGVE